MLRFAPPRRLRLTGVLAGLAAVAIVAVGIATRAASDIHVEAWTEANALPTVRVINLERSQKASDLVLPGNVAAFENAPIYARVSGYLKHWYTEIGTPVKKGQVLADIDTPDLDQQFEQAEGQLGTAVANERFAAVTAQRYLALKAQNAIALELVDQQVSAWDADKAATRAARANLRYLQAEESFKRLVAPFDGTVTSRGTDIGQLVTVGSPSAPPLFTVSDESKVRIYVSVPQDYSERVRPGLGATFTVPEYPGRVFAGTLVASASAVNTQSGTVLMQLQAPNADHALKAGDYAQIRFEVPADANAIRLPSSTLIFNEAGTAVATVDAGNRVVVKPVTILRDYGNSVEIGGGLSWHDRVIDSPPDSIRQGDSVRLAPVSRQTGS